MPTLTKDHAAARGDEVALIDEFGRTTWAELDDRVNRLVDALRAQGLSTGDTIAVVAGNRREWFEYAMACGHGGWTYVPVNWHWVADELAYVFDDADVVAVVVGHRYAGEVGDALRDDRSSAVRFAVTLPDPSGAAVTLGDVPCDVVDHEALVTSGDPAEPDDQRLGGPMFYTSGTTGRPKGVRSALSGNPDLTPEILQLIASGFQESVPIPGTTLLCGPFYHSAQWAYSFLPMVAGSAVTMQHKYDSAEVLEIIDRDGVTNTHLVPTQMKRLLDLPDHVKERYDGSTLQVVWHGAAPCPPKVKQGLIEWWGPKINEYYGATEGGVISTITSEEWLRKGGSIGKPLDQFEVIVVGDDGERLPQGQEGTLYFRNRMGMDFTYHKDESKTAAAHLEPGVFTMGDVGYLDDEGYLWLSDRKIDMIISGGVNIYPAEIEGVLAVHPDVADVAVIGVPDEEFGESVKAVVQVADGVEPSDELAGRLIAHARELLAGYKAPRSVDFIDEIPRTGTGKIQKKPLRAPYWEGHERRI